MTKERWIPQHKECCCYFPWTAGLSYAVAAGGLIVWITYSRKAFDSTNAAIDALQISKPPELQLVSTGLLAGAITFGVCMTLSVILSLWRSRLSSHVDDEGKAASSSGGYLTMNFLLNFVNWLVVFFLVVFIAVFAVWATVCFAIDKGAGAAYQFAGQAQGMAKQGVATAQDFLKFYDGFISEIRGSELKRTLDSAPNGLGTQLSDQFMGFVDQLDGEVSKLRNQLLEGECPIYCLNLAAISFINGDRCICDTEILNNASKDAKAAWQSVVPSLIGMLVMYVGGSWILMNLVASYARTASEQDLYDRMPYKEVSPSDLPVVTTGYDSQEYQNPMVNNMPERSHHSVGDAPPGTYDRYQHKQPANRGLYYVN